MIADNLAKQHLDGARSYVTTNDTFDQMGLRYHTHFKILLCVNGCTVLPDHAITHVEGHGINVTPILRRSCLDHIDQLELIPDRNISLPLPGGPPVEFLPLIEDGFCCNMCTYCAPSKRSVENHWYKTHPDEPLPITL